MPFYTFFQNQIGRPLKFDGHLSTVVVVEASSEQAAEALAGLLGIDQSEEHPENGMRWTAERSGWGTEQPMAYGFALHDGMLWPPTEWDVRTDQHPIRVVTRRMFFDLHII